MSFSAKKEVVPTTFKKRLIIWGASDQFRVVLPILRNSGYEVFALVDDTKDMVSPIPGTPLLYGVDGFNKFIEGVNLSKYGYLVAIANPYGGARVRISRFLESQGLMPISVIASSALISNEVIYKAGLQALDGIIVEGGVKIGRDCLLTTGALIMHDCILGDGVEVGPRAVICGRVTIGDYSWVGANATVLQRLTIGKNVIIGAGSVVTKNVPDNVIVTGVPAKVIRGNNYA